ncbi:DUF4190 domain-containing protein [Frankia gtarii]|uniref:DUF4190 domain-containing protein n=1 Tax=Frankia gtarii TaxID=2950102 RepID=UPI0021C0FB7A|nr:DUF4190 domain-containing protein [Frankia gtarii]
MTRPNTVHDAGTEQLPTNPPSDQPYDRPYREPYPPQSSPQYGGYGTRESDQTGYLPYPDNGQAQMQYGYQPQPVGPRPESSGTRALWILAFVFSAVALFVPFVGFAAIACGAVAWGKGSRRGRLATFVAIAATIVGWVLSILIYTS